MKNSIAFLSLVLSVVSTFARADGTPPKIRLEIQAYVRATQASPFSTWTPIGGEITPKYSPKGDDDLVNAPVPFKAGKWPTLDMYPAEDLSLYAIYGKDLDGANLLYCNDLQTGMIGGYAFANHKEKLTLRIVRTADKSITTFATITDGLGGCDGFPTNHKDDDGQ